MDEPKEIFAANFKRFMDEKGINQTDVALAVGASTSTVSDWATGKKYPRSDKMQKIAELLGVLMSDLNQEPGKRSEAAVITTEQERHLLTLFRDIPTEHHKFVLDLVEAALKNLR